MNSKGIYNKKKYFSLELLDILNKIFSYLDFRFTALQTVILFNYIQISYSDANEISG